MQRGRFEAALLNLLRANSDVKSLEIKRPMRDCFVLDKTSSMVLNDDDDINDCARDIINCGGA